MRLGSLLSLGYSGDKGRHRMKSTGLLLCYFLVKVLVCNAEGEPGQKLDGIIMVNDSKDGENSIAEVPHKEGRCSGYYDVMGQWDPPFNCTTGSYLYCCGTCGFRFCCEYKISRLDQTTCKNYDTPQWLKTGKPPPKRNDPTHDPTKDKTNLIVYIVCGVVAIMALVGIFTKLGLEKAHRPHRENMSRALAQVMRQPAPGEHSEGIGVHGQHYDTMQVSRPPISNQQSNQMNSVGSGSAMMAGLTPPHPYPPIGQLTHPYDQQQPGKELNKYASLKAVAEKSNSNFYTNRRHMVEMTSKGTLPMQPLRVEPEPSNPYSPPPQPSLKQNGHKSKSSKAYSSHSSHTLAYSSNTIGPSGMFQGWDGTETLGRRQTYDPKKHCTVEQVNEMHTLRSQHYMPPQPYFVTNSKTEVTV